MFSRKDWVTGSSYLLAAAGILAVLSLHLLHGLFAAMLVYMLVHLAQPLVGKSFAGQRGNIHLQNEYLIFRRDGVIEVIVPDLIVVLNADDGLALSTDMLRYGQRICVLALPAHELLRTPQALEVIGPKGFGFPELAFKAPEQGRN